MSLRYLAHPLDSRILIDALTESPARPTIATASFFTRGLDLADPRCVCIARSHPRGYHGRCYRPLAPSAALLRGYKAARIDAATYAQQYRAEVLDLQDPERVVEALGTDAILLCWEPAGKFCHRRLVAGWIERAMGIVVPEWTVEEAR